MSNRFDYDISQTETWPSGPEGCERATVILDKGPKIGPWTALTIPAGTTIESPIFWDEQKLYSTTATPDATHDTLILDQTVTDGGFQFWLTEAESAKLTRRGRYSFRLTLVYPTGQRTTFLQGQVRISSKR